MGVGLARSQLRTLSRVAQDRVSGVPSCLVGPQGVGKTVVARAVADALGYGRSRTRVLFCYADMTARDLLQVIALLLSRPPPRRRRSSPLSFQMLLVDILKSST